MSRRDYILDILTTIIGDKVKAEVVLERLEDEGVIHLGYGIQEIDQIVEKFTTVFGTTKTTKYDRWAAGRMAKKYGAQAVCGIIGLLGKFSQEKFAPVVNNVTELENKMPSVLNFIRNVSDNREVDL